MKFIVKVPEIHIAQWEIEAETPEQAQELAGECEGVEIGEEFIESVDCSASDWGVGHYDTEGNWVTDIKPRW